MSRENVETFKRALEAFNRGDIDAVLEGFDPEAEWHTAADLPDSRVYRGHDGVAALLQEWVDLFEDFHVEAEEFIDRGDYLVVPLLLHGRVPGSAESDQEVTLRRTQVDKVREGRFVGTRVPDTRTGPRSHRAAGRMKVKSSGRPPPSLAEPLSVRVTTS